MREEQDANSKEEPAAKELVTVDRLTRDRQRRDAKAKGRVALSTIENAERFTFQLFIGFRAFGLATIVCLIVGIMSVFIDKSDIPFLADFGFKPFALCLFAYVWLKVVWTKIGLMIDTNEALENIQDKVVDLECQN